MTKSVIQPGSSTSIRLQLSQILRKGIQDGVFAAGSRIPSERDLAERHGISRASVREAITELIEAGILFRTVGKGTFVSTERPAAAQPAAAVDRGIGFVIDGGVFNFVQTGYNRIMAGVESACREAGYRLYFQSFGEGGSSSDSVDSLGLPAGCIVVGAVSRHVLDRLRDAGTPYVLVDLLMSEGPASQLSVRIDYAAGTRAAMDHLYQLGHRRIGFIGFPGSERYRAYWQTLRDYGIPYDPRHVEFLSSFELQPGMVAGFAAMQRLAAQDSRATAILAVNDFVALGAMEHLKISGFSIPRDISIVGFDDLDVHTTPPLTTVRVDLQLVGRLAGQALFRKMNGGETDANESVVPVDLVIRKSTAPPSN